MKIRLSTCVPFVACFLAVQALAAKDLSVQVREAVVQEEPTFLSPVVGKLAYGERVSKDKSKEAWIRIEHDSGVEGWVHSSALTAKLVVLEAGEGDVELEASEDELALAGKGFSAQVEEEYRSQNQEIDFAWVDRMESFRLELDQLREFLEEGEVASEGTGKGPGMMTRSKGRFKRFGKNMARRTGSMVDSTGLDDTQVGHAFESITPEQEYYIGRTVAATILDRFPATGSEVLDDYLNRLGQALARASDRPETFGGYHFLSLASTEINAFAAPGGLIFVTRGMLALCSREDDVAAILAHEIAHVHHRHGLRSIRSGRLGGALTTLVEKGSEKLEGSALAEVTGAFRDSVGDISESLITNGYSRSAEETADKTAALLLARVGYDPYALLDVLEAMEVELEKNPGGFGRTHPDPRDRQHELLDEGDLPESALPGHPAREPRFAAALGRS